MFTLKTTLCTLIVGTAFALVACQPAEGPLERAGKSVDKATEKVGNEAEKVGDKIKDAVKDVKK